MRSSSLLAIRKKCDMMTLCRQVVAAGVPLSQRRTEAKGGVCMSDYEMIMIILTFLTLLVAVDKKNRG